MEYTYYRGKGYCYMQERKLWALTAKIALSSNAFINPIGSTPRTLRDSYGK